MKEHFDFEAALNDFMLGDRRLAVRSDIHLRMKKELDRVDRHIPLLSFALSQNQLVIGGQIVLDYVGRDFAQNEADLLVVLGLLYCYFREMSNSRLPRRDRNRINWQRRLSALQQGHARRLNRIAPRLALRLREIRQSLLIGRSDLASQIEVSNGLLGRWEAGALVAEPKSMYRWCRALGLFCPANTALVRVVDISPQLLQALKQNPEELRTLQPDQFESFIANRLDRMGYNVKLTGPTTRKDGGIDIVAVPKLMNAGSFVLAVQVKHHEGAQKTGRDAVDRLAAWNGPFRLGLLVTNTGFTRDAVWAAAQERNRHFLRLRDFDDLKRWLQDQYGQDEDWREIPETIELAPGIVIEVPKPRLYSPNADLLGGTGLASD